MNPYQLFPVSFDSLSRNILVGDKTLLPEVILSVSPCRSGTTAMLRVFGAAQIEAHYQQLKNVLRWQMQGQDRPWQLPTHQPRLFLKETLGPYTLTEAHFNPLELLLKVGFPADRLHILIVGRQPLHTWASWLAWWPGNTSLEIFIRAYQQAELIRQQAQKVSLPVTTFVYDAFKANAPMQVVEQLFKRLAIPFTPLTVTHWDRLPALGEAGSYVVFPEEPPAFDVPQLHDKVGEAAALHYFSRAQEVHQLSREDVAKIKASNLCQIYNQWQAACQKELNITCQEVCQ